MIAHYIMSFTYICHESFSLKDTCLRTFFKDQESSSVLALMLPRADPELSPITMDGPYLNEAPFLDRLFEQAFLRSQVEFI